MDSDVKWDDSRVQISPYMCDLNLKISDTNRAENVNYEGLGYCFGGAKATHGVRGGKVLKIIMISVIFLRYNFQYLFYFFFQFYLL